LWPQADADARASRHARISRRWRWRRRTTLVADPPTVVDVRKAAAEFRASAVGAAAEVGLRRDQPAGVQAV
jgi:hypothetical protein